MAELEQQYPALDDDGDDTELEVDGVTRPDAMGSDASEKLRRAVRGAGIGRRPMAGASVRVLSQGKAPAAATASGGKHKSSSEAKKKKKAHTGGEVQGAMAGEANTRKTSMASVLSVDPYSRSHCMQGRCINSFGSSQGGAGSSPRSSRGPH